MLYLHLLQTETAQVFHVKVFDRNQSDSRLHLWESLLPDEEDVQIAYPVIEHHVGYEPVYLATKESIPDYHERFIGYGATRNTQVRM